MCIYPPYRLQSDPSPVWVASGRAVVPHPVTVLLTRDLAHQNCPSGTHGVRGN